MARIEKVFAVRVGGYHYSQSQICEVTEVAPGQLDSFTENGGGGDGYAFVTIAVFTEEAEATALKAKVDADREVKAELYKLANHPPYDPSTYRVDQGAVVRRLEEIMSKLK